MGRVFTEYLPPGGVIYCCSGCGVHLTKEASLVSKAFRGRTGKAFLFEVVINYTEGPEEEKPLITGLHVIVNIYCFNCGQNVGWKYIEAYDPQCKYKEGKFILEKALIVKVNDDASHEQCGG